MLTGGDLRNYLGGRIQAFWDSLFGQGEQAAQDSAQFDFGPDLGPELTPETQRQSAITAFITERIRQIEDAVGVLQREIEVGAATGQEADLLQSLERQQALLELQRAIQRQEVELGRFDDSAFVEEANAQHILGLRRQAAELQQQIVALSSPEAQRLQQQIASLNRTLATLEEVPFDVEAFAQDRRDALLQQVAEAEALASLADDPVYQAARSRLAETRVGEEGVDLQAQLDNFARLSEQRQENEALRLELSTLEAQEAARRVRALAGLLQNEQLTRDALQNAQLEQQVESFRLPAQTALRRQNQFLQDVLNNLTTFEDLATFLARAPQRIAASNLAAQLRIAQLGEDLEQFGNRAPQRLQERGLTNRLELLQRAEGFQNRLNNLSVEYYETAAQGIADLLTSAQSFADVVRGILRNVLQTTVQASIDATLGQSVLSAIASGSSGGAGGGGLSGGGTGALLAGAAGKPTVGALTVNVSLDARGGDQQSIQRGIDQALPKISRVVMEGQLAALSDNPGERDRLRQAMKD